MTTQDQRAEWRALAQAATPGEWKPRISEETTDHEVIMFDVEIDYTVTVAMCTSMLRYMDNEPNARFIAAARTAVPALLADVDALQAEAERNAANQENAALTREVAGLRYYIAQLERNVSQEERAYAAQVAQMMLAAQEAQP